MFRRIELVYTRKPSDAGSWRGVPGLLEHYKGGLMSGGTEEVADAWIAKLRGPYGRAIPANARFYFTERGWREVGRPVVEACGHSGQRYRVIAVKENSVNVIWRDKVTDLEVAAQPRKRRPFA